MAKGLGLEVLHLIEKRFAHEFALDIKPEYIDDILSVAIDKDLHRKITAEIRKAIGYSNEVNKEWITSNAKPQIIWYTLVSVYQQHGIAEYLPELKEQLLKIANNVDQITDWCGY